MSGWLLYIKQNNNMYNQILFHIIFCF